MSGITLYEIESALLELAQAREELVAELEGGLAAVTQRDRSEAEAELAEVDKAITEYATSREPAKVDSIHSLLKMWHITAEVARQEVREYVERAQRIEANEKRLKQMVCDIMETSGKKRIEGTGGRYLLRKGNGGLEPLVLQEDIIPADYIDVTVRMSLREAETLGLLNRQDVPVLSREPANARIRAALKAQCASCGGDGAFRATEQLDGEMSEVQCRVCGGTGHMAVPGAHLEERGFHVECK